MMKPPRLILCATDLGPGGDRAVREAHGWADRYGAALVFVHAIPDASRLHVLFPQFAQSAFEALPDALLKAADAVSGRVEQLTGRPRAEVEVKVDVGSPAAVIVDQAEELKADLLVIGATGKDEARPSLGQVALRVIRHAHSPVLVARAGAEHGPILVASDLSNPAFPAISAGAFLAQGMGEQLSVIHVADFPQVSLPSPEAAGLGVAFALNDEDLQLLRESARDRLNSAMSRLGITGQCLVEQGIPAVHVVAAARRLEARLLVIGTEGRTGLRRMLLGSTAEQILSDAGCPVMVVRLNSEGEHS